MVWASRRTSVLEPVVWQQILADDGYRMVLDREIIHPGDLALYVDLENEDEILHVGRVYLVQEGLAPGARPIPWVLSKWDSTSGECMHQCYDVFYFKVFAAIEVRFFTDRPAAGVSL
jgi:hypothetical protein